MNKKVLLVVGMLIILVGIGFVLFNKGASLTYDEKGKGYNIGALEKTYTPTQWIVDNNSVWIDDVNVIINVSPHTSREPIINFMAKNYSGNVDIVFGFDSNTISPNKIYANPTIEQQSESYTCPYEFNYTTNPKHFWCYINFTNNGTIVMVKDHDYDTGNVGTKTASWSVPIEVWHDITTGFTINNVSFEGMNKWYVMKNINVNAGQNYKIKVDISVKEFKKENRKYWFAIKPSSETLLESIQNNHFYALDPWASGYNTGLIRYYSLNETTGDMYDASPYHENATYGGSASRRGLTGLHSNSNNSFLATLEPTYARSATAVSVGTDDATVCFWTKVANHSSIGHFLKMGDGGNANPTFACLSGFGSDYNSTVQFNWGDAANPLVSTAPLTMNQTYFICSTYNESKGFIYINGVLNNTQTKSTNMVWGGDFEIGIRDAGGTAYPLNGYMDEMMMWNRTLSSTEISDLYTGNLTFYTGAAGADNSPTVTPYVPADNTNYTTTPIAVNFTCYGQDDINLTKMELYINGTLSNTNTSQINNTNYTFSRTLTDANFNWTCNATDNSSQSTSTTTRYFVIDGTAPNLNIYHPVNGTTYGQQSLYLNLTSTSSDLQTIIYNWNGSNFTYTTLGIAGSLGENFTMEAVSSGKSNNTPASNLTTVNRSYTLNTGADSTVAILGDSVYVTSGDVGAGNAYLYRLWRENMTQVWNRSLSSTYAFGGVTLCKDPVFNQWWAYVGDQNGVLSQINTTSGVIYASYDTGALQISKPATCSPDNTIIAVPSHNNGVYVLNTSNVSKLISTAVTGDAVLSTPCFSDNGSYLYYGDNAGYIHERNATNIAGGDTANVSVASEIWKTLSCKLGKVVFGTNGGTVFVKNQTGLSAICNIAMGGSVHSPPSIDDDNIFMYGGYAGGVKKIFLNNCSVGGSLSTPSAVNEKVIITNNTIIFPQTTTDYRIIELNKTNMATMNNRSLSTEAYGGSFGNGFTYFGLYNGSVLQFGTGGSFSGGSGWDGNITFNTGSNTLNAWANDTYSNIRFNSTTFTITGADTTAPTYTGNSTNSTESGTAVQHRLKWTDETGLSGYIFSFKNGTSFVNDSFISFTTNPQWVNVTKVINSTNNTNIQWIVYANDTTNNWNVSQTYSYIGINTTSSSTPYFNWSNGVVSYYKLDETSGVIIDESQNINATNSGTTYSAIGKIGTAHSFDGIDDMINGTSNIGISGSANRSICAWVNVTSTTDEYIVALGGTGAGNGFTLKVASGIPIVDYYGSSTTSNTTVLTNQWYFICTTYNGTQTRIYTNGSIVSIQNVGALTTPNGKIYLGNSNTGGGSGTALNGIIDEVSLFNRTLNSTEIESLWNSGNGISYNGLFTNVNLISPTTASTLIAPTLFNASYYFSNNLTNTTYYIWHTNGTLFNSTTISLTGIANTSSINFTNFTSGNYIWNVYACGGDGIAENCSFSGTNYTFIFSGFTNNGEEYNTPVIEMSSQSFIINISITQGFQLQTGKLIYNGTSYDGLITLLGGNSYQLTKNLITPEVSSDTNYSFYWSITTNDGSITNTTSHIQTVQPFVLDDCNTYTNQILNITMYNERTQLPLNASSDNTTIEVNLNLYSSANSLLSIFNFTKLYNKVLPARICSSIDLVNTSYIMDVQIKYFADNYQIEYYHIQRYVLNSTSDNQFLYLYDLFSTEAQIFKISYKDSNFLPISNALIQITRKYIDQGIFKTVEIPMTDDYGETVASFVLNDVVYTINVIKNGVTLGTFNNVRVVCQTPSISECRLDLNSLSTAISLPNYTTIKDFSYVITNNKTTRQTIVSFVVPSGNSSTITLNVTKSDALGTSACSQSLITSSGFLTCNYTSSIGNGTLDIHLYKDNVLVGTGQVNLGQTPTEIFGSVAVLLAIFVFLTLLGASLSDNPIFTIIFLLVGVILLFALNLVSHGGFIGYGATILFLIIAIFLIIMKGSKRQ